MSNNELEQEYGEEIVEHSEENNSENEPYNATYNLSSFGMDFPVFGLIKKFKEKDIYLPEFQRNYVWTKRQASKFIESILIGLPVPEIFLYQEDDGKMLILDGYQRINSLSMFKNGRFSESSDFKLDVKSSDLNGLNYDKLDKIKSRKFNDTPIHATIVRANYPQQDNYLAIYEIFERLNTGGTKLSPQEVRNCVSHGKFREKIFEFSQNDEVRKILNVSNKRKKDEEIILRLIALACDYNNYQGNMKQFLSDFMFKNKDLSLENGAIACIDRFIELAYFINTSNLNEYFKPNKQLSLALLDSIWVGIYKNFNLINNNIETDIVKRRLNNLINNQEFKDCIKTGTTHHKDNVIKRIDLAIQILSTDS